MVVAHIYTHHKITHTHVHTHAHTHTHTHKHTHTNMHICKHVHKVRRAYTLHNITSACNAVGYTNMYMLHSSAVSGIK